MDVGQQTYQPMAHPFAGLGVGLPLARLYARYWGGDLRLLSIKGQGTHVAIYVPSDGGGELLPPRSLPQLAVHV
jgi:signal transduction histidine kinase